MTWININSTDAAALGRIADAIGAAFSGRPGAGTLSTFFSVAVNNLEVQFVDQSSSAGGSILSWLWSFGDGGSSTLQNPAHTYAAGGDYTVTLTVTDSGGRHASSTGIVTAVDEPDTGNEPILPVAAFSVVTNSLTATFTDQSTDADGSVVDWDWDFGEGPTSAFTWSATGLSSRLTDQSTAPAPLTVSSWLWDLGDGTTSTSSNTLHTYATGGAKTVRLTVTSSNGNTDISTQVVQITGGGATLGIPFGPTQQFNGDQTRKSNTTQFNLTLDVVNPSNVTKRIEYAAANGVKLLLYLTGGAAADYLTNGVFDSSKWTDKLQTFNTSAIKSSIGSAVANGVVLGASMIDEPFNQRWGPSGTLTKASVDAMATATKSLFTTLPCGTFHSWQEFQPNSSYTVIDFIISAYWTRYGNAQSWLNSTLSMCARDHHTVCFGINILDGGTFIAGCGNNATPACCPQTTTEGPGTFGGTDHYNCRMLPSLMTTYAQLFGPNGCGFVMWRYDDAAMSTGSWVTKNHQAWESMRTFFAALPQKSWRRTN